jgi:hypothetical protein
MAVAGYGDSVEGLHAVEAALDAGRVLELFFERRHQEGDASLVDRARLRGVKVRPVDDVRPRPAPPPRRVWWHAADPSLSFHSRTWWRRPRLPH